MTEERIVRRVFIRTSASLALCVLAACGDRRDAHTTRDSTTAKPAAPGVANTTLTPDQLEHLKIAPVASVAFRPEVQTTGTVAFDGDMSTQVLAPISGPVMRILVQPGTWVKKGDALATVSSPDFAAAVSDFRKAQATAVQTRRVATLDSALFKNDAIARRDMEQAQTDAVSAEADRDAALQALEALGVDAATLGQLRDNKPVASVQGVIRAPIEGTVVEKLINPGQLLAAGTTPTFTIADLSTVWVMASVFESDLASVAHGDKVDIVTGASPRPLAGTVDYVAALVDPATKATQVSVVVPNTGHLLKRDMYVTATIHASREKHGILLPVSAVLRDENNLPFVFVQLPAGGFERRQVTLGSRVGGQYEISAGLKEGERVIQVGGLFLQFAQSQ
ncbi:MAG: efflux RND transporter periplasmic adaptor subunit [Gemmatimonadaceae bacterium]|nr:efflux RND transporter periplasmic adaptor subunit [Gemmatimonadaceae bacterium]